MSVGQVLDSSSIRGDLVNIAYPEQRLQQRPVETCSEGHIPKGRYLSLLVFYLQLTAFELLEEASNFDGIHST